MKRSEPERARTSQKEPPPRTTTNQDEPPHSTTTTATTTTTIDNNKPHTTKLTPSRRRQPITSATICGDPFENDHCASLEGAWVRSRHTDPETLPLLLDEARKGSKSRGRLVAGLQQGEGGVVRVCRHTAGLKHPRRILISFRRSLIFSIFPGHTRSSMCRVMVVTQLHMYTHEYKSEGYFLMHLRLFDLIEPRWKRGL